MGISPQLDIVDVSLTEDGRDEALVKIRDALKKLYYHPERRSSGSFVMAVDHCFPIKGKGTVATGTVLDGECHVGDTVQLPQVPFPFLLRAASKGNKFLHSWMMLLGGFVESNHGRGTSPG